jgi:MurNAc alpha-1-phosphate uridylyltransferase
MRLDTAMILSAGMGTRMRPLTDNCPKPLVKVGQRPLIEYALDQVRAIEASRAIVNTHYLAAQMEAYFTGYTTPKVVLSHEDIILETGGGVVKALPLIDRPAFFTLNSDAFWSNTQALATLNAHWKPEEMDALLLLTPRDNAYAYTRDGDFHLTDSQQLVRRTPPQTAPYVYTGAQIIKASAFDGAVVEPFSLNIIWEKLLHSGRCYGCVYNGLWGDIGTPAGLTEAEKNLLPQYSPAQ